MNGTTLSIPDKNVHTNKVTPVSLEAAGQAILFMLEECEARVHLSASNPRAASAGEASIIHSTSSLSRARLFVAATSVGGKALFAGGRLSDNTITDVVDIFDEATRQWSTATLSQPRGEITAASVEGKALFAGGEGTGGYSDVVDIYDAVNGTWSTTTLPRPRRGAIGLTAGDKVIFAGGEDAAVNRVVDIYDASTGEWSSVKPPLAYFGAGTVVGGKVLLSAGGGLDVYDITKGTWSAAVAPPNLTSPAVSVGSRAIFGGGPGGFAGSGEILVFDSVTGDWSMGALSQARVSINAVALGTKALFGGGRIAFGESVDVADVYDLSTGRFSTTSLAEKRFGTGSTTLGVNAFFAGGSGASFGESTAPSLSSIDVFTDTAPTAALDGNIATIGMDKAIVTIRNTGDAAFAGPYQIIVYGARDGHRSVVLGRAGVTKSLRAGASGQVTVSLSFPQGTRLSDFRLEASTFMGGRDTAFAADFTLPQFSAKLISPQTLKKSRKSYVFTISYHSLYAIDTHKLDDNDIVVTGPNGFEQHAHFVSQGRGKHGSTRQVVYSVRGPDGIWETGTNGTYTIHVQEGEVNDTAGNAVPSRRVGTFSIAIIPHQAASLSETGMSATMTTKLQPKRMIDKVFR